jgi:hypothetical protein
MPRHDPLTPGRRPKLVRRPQFNPEAVPLPRSWPDPRDVRAALNGTLGWVVRAILKGQGKRKPPEAGIALPAIPPRGPLPLQGGAEAPLEFDD